MIVSPNWPFVKVVALFKQEHGSEMEGAQVVEDTFTDPVITCEQPVEVFVATTVYAPTVPCEPKLIEAPVPGTGVPVFSVLESN